MFKVVITDYVWESLDVETKTLAGIADIVALKTKKPDEFLGAAADCDALLNTYAGPISAHTMARMPKASGCRSRRWVHGRCCWQGSSTQSPVPTEYAKVRRTRGHQHGLSDSAHVGTVPRVNT